MPKIIDLSVCIDEKSAEPAPPKIEKIYHKAGSKVICKKMLYFGKKGLIKKLKSFYIEIAGKQELKPDSFPEGEFLSNEIVTATTHTGTHVDAPWHYGSKCEGVKAKTIDEIPLENFYGDGVVLDLSYKSGGSLITVEDIQNALEKIQYSLKAGDIVLIRTGYDKKWGSKEYFSSHPGMGREATEYIVDHGIKVLGIDAYGFDRPFQSMIDDFIKTQNRSYLWPAHFFGRTKEYYHIERLANLDKILKPYGFKVACFPIKIKDVGAAWVRAVAIIEDDIAKTRL